jgi:hypothetical protein
MADGLFNLTEAEELIPQLELWLSAAIDSRKKIAVIEEEESELLRRVALYGGMFLDVPSCVRRKEEKERCLSVLRGAARDIENTGCLLKDLDTGLIDFPCEWEGREVYLCWKLGEPAIRFWHGIEEGFAGRKPIDGVMMERLKSPLQ